MSSKKELSNLFIEKWRNFVDNHPNGNYFQTPAYVDFISSVINYKADIISHIIKDEIIGVLVYMEQKEGIYLKRYFSNRCIVYGGPLVLLNAEKNETASLLLQKLKEQTSAIYIEFRNLFDTTDLLKAFVGSNYFYKPHLNYIVSLSNNTEITFLLLNSSRRRQVRKSQKSGAEIIIPSSIEEVKKFYELLLKLYKSKIKKPLPPWSFFYNFYFIKDTGKYFLIKYENTIIGGIMCPISDDTIYEWYVAGADKAYSNVYPSVLATWAPMEFGSKNGIKFFNFMGAGKPEKDYSVREFKSKFGGQKVENGRHLFIKKPLLYSIGKLGLRFYGLIK